jgi:drug/metabolite transporter (DMT)-like permease
MRHEPIGFVSSLRESSIIMASLIGYFVLKEKVSHIRLISGVVFFVGVVLVYNS